MDTSPMELAPARARNYMHVCVCIFLLCYIALPLYVDSGKKLVEELGSHNLSC